MDTRSDIFDAIRSNKITFFEYQEYMTREIQAAYDDGYGFGWSDAMEQAYQASQDDQEGAKRG